MAEDSSFVTVPQGWLREVERDYVYYIRFVPTLVLEPQTMFHSTECDLAHKYVSFWDWEFCCPQLYISRLRKCVRPCVALITFDFYSLSAKPVSVESPSVNLDL